MSASLTQRIAVIGMACEFPGAHSPPELWHNVLAGRRFFRKAPKERLAAGYFDPDETAVDKTYSDLMAVLEGWLFDPVAFGIAPVTVQASDITHWLALHTAHAALQDAGLKFDEIDRNRIGVVLGNTLAGEFARSHLLRHRWPYVERSLRYVLAQRHYRETDAEYLVMTMRRHYLAPLPAITEDSLAGNMANTIAGRICSHFDLRGGGYIVDGACSSSLLSVAHACNALASEELDVVLAGGVDVSLDPFEIIGFAKAQALSRDDIFPYDQRACGMLPGEGCGLFVLMREAQARACGHTIHAVIRGWGISSDGAGSITAPGIEGQVRALQIAYQRAGYPLASVGLIEGHGTGTALGDKVEIAALRQFLAEQGHEQATGICRIGSIKGQIGHCKAAAGSAGLIKAIMALQRKIFPPTGNCSHPNAAFGLPMTMLRPQLHGEPWPSGAAPRRVAVSAMGFGGSNAHITLEESNPDDQPAPDELAMLGSAQSTELVLLSAANLAQLRQRIDVLLQISERLCGAELSDLAAALSQHAPSGDLRLAVVTHSPRDLNNTLRRVAEKLADGAAMTALDDVEHNVFAATANKHPVLAALFPGQGSQYLNMGQHLLRRYPFARQLHDEVDSVITQHIYHDVLSADETCNAKWTHALRATEVAQPAIALHTMMTLQVLQYFGLQPDLAVGHSLGEISALAAAGAWDAKTAIQLAAARGNAIAALPLIDTGGMLALAATAEQTAELIELAQSDVQIANLNAPQQTVVSGSTQSIHALHQWCQRHDVASRQLPVSHAFHSKLVAPAADSLRISACGHWQQARIGTRTKVISSSSGATVTTATDLCELLCAQIGSPVRFTQAINLAAKLHPDLWIEIGPGNVLSGLLRDILGSSAAPVLPTEVAGDEGFYCLNRLLAAAYVRGFPVATRELFAHRFHRPFDIDNFHPQFIVNPCERNAERNTLEASELRVTPKAASTQIASIAQVSPAEVLAASEVPTPLDHAAMFSCIALWLANRTGFPRAMIQPETRLRDDLNLDSIKVGELLVQMAKESHQPLRIDPLPLSNASLDQLIEAFLRPRPKPAGANGDAGNTTPSPDDAQWIDTFNMVAVLAPIESESVIALPRSTRLALVGESVERTTAIVEALRQHGLSAQQMEAATVCAGNDALSCFSTFVWLLPTVDQALFSATREENLERVEADASALFHFFRSILNDRQAPLHGLLLRPLLDDEDGGADSQAGAAFVKTLALEYPELAVKWVAMPAAWTPQQWADTIARELQTAGRPAVSYTADGQRQARVAIKLPAQHSPPALSAAVLGAQDVVLVSGGARGITFELALDLARRTSASLALLGSSSLSSADEEVRRHCAQLDIAGLHYCYLQVDVADQEAVQQAVKLAERTLGPITAILHGAGTSTPRRLREKPLEEYLHCIRVKACGLINLVDAVASDTLKALHVISSVLGNTGMHGQIDYAYANAWLDGAVRAFKKLHPRTHCLSLGYTVWSDIGLGHRLGALENLRALGVTPVSPQQGVAAYRRLASTDQASTQFVITGRLSSALEANLYAPPPLHRPRFLDTILTWVPGIEIAAQARLSHASDLYLTEHVFDANPLFPAVMAIEAMVQVAQACMVTAVLPVVRNILFHRPLVVPHDSIVTIRVRSEMVESKSSACCVHAKIQTEADDFRCVYVEAECWFGLPDAEANEAVTCPTLPPPLAKNPEDFSPTPLFQGKFFRRISNVHRWEMEQESLTDIAIPNLAVYYQGPWLQTTVTPFPIGRDAALQSGAIILPPGFLPASIGELRFHGAASKNIVCRAIVQKRAATHFSCSIFLFDHNGVLLETMKDLVLHATRNSGLKLPNPVFSAIPLEHLAPILPALSQHGPHALAFSRYPESLSDRPTLRTIDSVRTMAAAATLTAVRCAAEQFAWTQLQLKLSADCVYLDHRADGKPLFRCEQLPDTLDVTISHADGIAMALLGPAPVGIDLERISCRDCETWRGLLGIDGYTLALRIQRTTGESFDCAATRVWTVLEAGRKASLSRAMLGALTISISRDHKSLRLDHDQSNDYVSVLIAHSNQHGVIAVLTITVPKLVKPGTTFAGADASDSPGPAVSVPVPNLQLDEASRLKQFQEEIHR